MREIVLDTETTGLSPHEGHRIVEIGAIELNNHFPTGKYLQLFLNPERDMPKEAEAIHGLSSNFLKDKPTFKTAAAEFLLFIEDSPLVIHNASFDVGFINAELAGIGLEALAPARIIDTLQMARRLHPAGPNSLDALCRRYSVDNSRRTKHGALLDAELLADVYLELVGGRQTTFGLQALATTKIKPVLAGATTIVKRPSKLGVRLTPEEIEAHQAAIKALGPSSNWLETDQA